jgi:hypothetical protein
LWTRWWTLGFHKESRIFFNKLSDNQLFKQYLTTWGNYHFYALQTHLPSIIAHLNFEERGSYVIVR